MSKNRGRDVFVTNTPSCSRTGKQVANCGCGGHGRQDDGDTLPSPPTLNEMLRNERKKPDGKDAAYGDLKNRRDLSFADEDEAVKDNLEKVHRPSQGRPTLNGDVLLTPGDYLIENIVANDDASDDVLPLPKMQY